MEEDLQDPQSMQMFTEDNILFKFLNDKVHNQAKVSCVTFLCFWATVLLNVPVFWIIQCAYTYVILPYHVSPV